MWAYSIPMTSRTPQDLDVPDAENRTTIGPGTNVKLALFFALSGVLAWGGWVTSELSTIKNASLNSANSQSAVAMKVELHGQRLDNLELRGSTPMQSLQRSVDKLAEELRVHEAKTELRANGAGASSNGNSGVAKHD